MNRYQVTVVQVVRMQIEVMAEDKEDAKKGWGNGRIVQQQVLSDDVIDVLDKTANRT